jgi:hypothetical protein
MECWKNGIMGTVGKRNNGIVEEWNGGILER